MSREKGLKYIMSANTPFVDKGYHNNAAFAPHKPHKTRIKLQTYDFSLSNIKVLLVLFSPDKPLIDTKQLDQYKPLIDENESLFIEKFSEMVNVNP